MNLMKKCAKLTEEMLKDESIDQRDFSLKLVESS